jgi:ubiquinone/menaquinone biosynthesis C-methylase UbiE
MSKKEDKNRVCPVERAKYLDRAIRKWIQSPNKILKSYIKEGMKVIDFGCGPGYFTLEIARLVGESGKVIAVDLQQGMLDIVRHKIEGTELEKRITLVKCESDSINVHENVDSVFAFYVIHEVPDKRNFFANVKNILKTGGILYIVEPKGHVSNPKFEEMIKWSEDLGFQVHSRPKIFFSRAVLLDKK